MKSVNKGGKIKMVTEKIIQGLKVAVTEKPYTVVNITVVNFVVYKNMLWCSVGYQGAGINFVRKLERFENGCSIVKWIKGEDLKTIEYVIRPTGYIDLKELGKVQLISKLQFTQFVNKELSHVFDDKLGKRFCDMFNIDNDELKNLDKNEALEIITRYVKL